MSDLKRVMTRVMPAAPPPCVWCRASWLLFGGLVALSFYTMPLQWAAFTEPANWARMREFLAGFAPPELGGAFLIKLALAAAETLAMSVLGTLLAAIAGLALALPASRPSGVVRAVVRWLLNALRAIPELVWALVLIIAAGLGPFAGTLALAIHTAGVLGRLFADTFENAPKAAADALRINGASRVQILLYAQLPQTLPQLVSYTLYRWENNIRAAAVLGVVGAGGLGQMLKYHLSLFQMPDAASVIIAMLVMVAAVDGFSVWLRRRMG